MATLLSKPVTRETRKVINRRAVLLTIAPAGSQSEALIGLRLKGTRTEYVIALSDVYRMAALWHGQKIARAKKQARTAGIAWRTARKTFDRANRITTETTTTITTTPANKISDDEHNDTSNI